MNDNDKDNYDNTKDKYYDKDKDDVVVLLSIVTLYVYNYVRFHGMKKPREELVIIITTATRS